MIYDIDQTKLIEAIGEQLKKELKTPSWAQFVKTGVHKERAPTNPDWWFIRAAAVLRTVHLRGPIGTEKLRTKYGGSKNRGVKPNKFAKGSGSVLRKVLQQLETAGYVTQTKKGTHKGRVATIKGIALLQSVAKEVGKNGNV